MDHTVFIQTNHKQITGAIVAEYALRRYSSHNDSFDVQIIHTKDYPWFAEHEGKTYLRDGLERVWLNDDLQSFTLTRFMPPELMGYQGRAVVIDPDIFAATDVWDLLSRDMQGKAVMCRPRSGTKGFKDHCMATSVMLLDCAKLTHWKVREQFEAMFAFKRAKGGYVYLGSALFKKNSLALLNVNGGLELGVQVVGLIGPVGLLQDQWIGATCTNPLSWGHVVEATDVKRYSL